MKETYSFDYLANTE